MNPASDDDIVVPLWRGFIDREITILSSQFEFGNIDSKSRMW